MAEPEIPPLPLAKKIASGIIQLLMVVAFLALVGSYFWVVNWLLKGGPLAFDTFSFILQKLDTGIISILLLLLASSIFKRMRPIAGGSLCWGALLLTYTFWPYCLYVTYAHWGKVGLIVGIGLVFLGIFATAPLSLLFAGEYSDSLDIVLFLALIYAFWATGTWLTEKHEEGLWREKEENARRRASYRPPSPEG
jgi:hypothetical protein